MIKLKIFLDFLFFLLVLGMTATALFFFDAVTAMALASCTLILLPDFILILHMMLEFSRDVFILFNDRIEVRFLLYRWTAYHRFFILFLIFQEFLLLHWKRLTLFKRGWIRNTSLLARIDTCGILLKHAVRLLQLFRLNIWLFGTYTSLNLANLHRSLLFIILREDIMVKILLNFYLILLWNRILFLTSIFAQDLWCLQNTDSLITLKILKLCCAICKNICILSIVEMFDFLIRSAFDCSRFLLFFYFLLII